MLNVQFNIKNISALKELFVRLRHDGLTASIQVDFDRSLKDFSFRDILLIQLELINGDYGITIEDVKDFSSIYPDLSKNATIYDPGHPVQVFKEENAAFQVVMSQIKDLFELIDKNQNRLQKTNQVVDELKHIIFRLGEFRNHYNRKEKLYFPILERYGYYAPARTVWRVDIRIGALYQALKKQFDEHHETNIERVRKRYDVFEKEFKEMIYQEEAIILPILQTIFSEEDWAAIANESDAFGYAIIETPGEIWTPKSETLIEDALSGTLSAQTLVYGGGGYLTTEEAKLIFDNLPLEITFVDKNDMFKYFNKVAEASEMMLVRTPISIGRNVANCHPPKSLMKVMTLIRDLKTGKRTSESMWYKKNGQYIHLTYKALFNEEKEFMGVLEYVQDIQPFFDLPSEVKTGLSKLDE
ncbi:PAS domain-containing protein [Sporosarcina sp. FA9]|uniref:PAS domain-containing protein n=1 Tax=Sporosarcina sp. FA9 TaxID=3413030 RepID=UPI003F655985